MSSRLLLLQPAFSLLLLELLCCRCQSDKEYTTWSHYKGSPERIHYSSLTEIDTANVSSLRVAWVFRTGDADTVHNSRIPCNPIVVDGRLYGTTPQMALFALDAATGKRKWHFQLVHPDVWDRDVPAPPALLRYRNNGSWIDAAAVTTKTGLVYVFDRETGKPLFPVEEKPVPAVSELRGEKLSPTQPVPVAPAPFVRQRLTAADLNPYLSDSSFANVKRRLASYRNGHMFEPISRQGTTIFPGLDGGAEWGGPTFDPETGMLYMNANEMAWVLQAVDISRQPAPTESYEQTGKRLYQNNCMSCRGAERQGPGNNPSLIVIEKKYSPAAFYALVQSGRRMMPAFKQLNENEREAIATYVLNRSEAKAKSFAAAKQDERFQLPFTITGYNKFLSKEGHPAIAPPWGNPECPGCGYRSIRVEKNIGS